MRKVLLILVVSLLCCQMAFACQCGSSGGRTLWEIAKSRAKAGGTIFEGKVISTRLSWNAVDAKDGEWITAGYRDGHDVREFPHIISTFQISKSYGDSRSGTIEVSSGVGGGDCGYAFVVGEQYLVFAYTNHGKDNTDMGLWTGMCSGNAMLTEDSPELRYLRGEIPQPDDLVDLRDNSKVDRMWQKARQDWINRRGRVCVSIDGARRNDIEIVLFRGYRDEIPAEAAPDGRFCTAPLTPGSYFVLAKTWGEPRVGPTLMTFYPGVYYRDRAQPVLVRPGETTSVEFRTIELKTQKVRVLLAAYDMEELLSNLDEGESQVWLIRLDGQALLPTYQVPLGSSRLARWTHIRGVTFESVLPGRYAVFVTAGAQWMMKKQTIEVADRSQSVLVRLKKR